VTEAIPVRLHRLTSGGALGIPPDDGYVDSFQEGILMGALVPEVGGYPIPEVSMRSAEDVKASFRTGAEIDIVCHELGPDGKPFLAGADGVATKTMRVRVVR